MCMCLAQQAVFQLICAPRAHEPEAATKDEAEVEDQILDFHNPFEG
ncbi:hypothetical protein A2U01_0064176 [Trifolium medium]|uniref:Uncharacterized protein n=1 Tax=Trifolium medium TaxID=97028 RepID=A0A392S2N3_9FABA|nr:hypothetical protein [Trifolium medium]